MNQSERRIRTEQALTNPVTLPPIESPAWKNMVVRAAATEPEHRTEKQRIVLAQFAKVCTP